MKRSLFLCLCLVAIVACKKSKNDDQDLIDDHGCIERVEVPKTAHAISSAQVDSANAVLTANGMDHSNYRYIYFTHYLATSNNPPYTPTDNINLVVQQYVNNLPVLSSSLQLVFKNNVLDNISGDEVTTVNLDTVPHLDVTTLRKLFITDVQRYTHNAAFYKDTCLGAQFGYYSLVTNTVTNQRTVIKAWKVARKNTLWPYGYPQAVYRDDDGSRIYFTIGIVPLLY